MTKKLILFTCWSHRPVHGTLVQAAGEALINLGWRSSFIGCKESVPLSPSPHTWDQVMVLSPLRGLLRLLYLNSKKPNVLFLQSTHPVNIIWALWAHLNQIPIIYYLHEPTPLIEKIRKGDSIGYAIAVWVTQYFETLMATAVLVATKPLLEQVREHFYRSTETVHVLPLAIPFPKSKRIESHQPVKNRVLYLGRAHQMREIEAFISIAEYHAKIKSELKFTILTYNHITAPSFIETTAGETYSDELMLKMLDESLLVWNVYNVHYSQSGVTPVALRSGIPLLVSSFEKEKSLLTSRVAFEVQIHPVDIHAVAHLIKSIKSDFDPISHACKVFYEKNYSPTALIPYFKNILALCH